MNVAIICGNMWENTLTERISERISGEMSQYMMLCRLNVSVSSVPVSCRIFPDHFSTKSGIMFSFDGIM